MIGFQNFQTERLNVAEITTLSPKITDDLERILIPTVTAFLPPSAQLARFEGDVAEWVSHQKSEGATLMLITCDSVGVGLVMLHNGDQGAAMIGYMFAHSAWGRGYASELVLGLVAMLRGAGFQYAYGGVADQNPASARVLEKAGFELVSHQAETKMFRRTLGNGHA